MTDTLWSPTARIENSALREDLNWLEEREGRPFPDHDAFWAWSVEVYDVLETMPEISEALVVGVDQPDDGYWLGLFVVPASGHALDEDLKQRIVTTLRTRLTPRHVPDEIVEAPAVPHTLSGKRLEVPIKKLLTGRPLEKAANIASVDDPDALRWYARFAADRLE
ncbi:AMP-binding enzyme [Pseudonocardia bannensis]|uniref:AMP-binding enzyme n=1 Tax=Pseudonocardia bannensis TaxID=630973 RepID=UPI001FE254BE|nr:hypothetical protein [Pseudonocardia bannensis]